MTIARCVIFKTSLSTSSTSRLGLLNQRPGMGHRPQRGALSDCKLAPTQPSLTPTDSTAASICIYYFITLSYFRLDHVIFFRLLTQVRRVSDWRLGQKSICNTGTLSRNKRNSYHCRWPGGIWSNSGRAWQTGTCATWKILWS